MTGREKTTDLSHPNDRYDGETGLIVNVRKREAGPGIPVPVSRPFSVSGSPWWYDYSTHEIVRSSDGMRWAPREIPEFERSLFDRTNPVVDVDEVDRWVLAQSSKE